jgi:hypothetical protein
MSVNQFKYITLLLHRSDVSDVGNVIGVYVNYIQAVMNKVWDRPQETSALTTAKTLDNLLGILYLSMRLLRR